jgi:hypothetical protein
MTRISGGLRRCSQDPSLIAVEPTHGMKHIRKVRNENVPYLYEAVLKTISIVVEETLS